MLPEEFEDPVVLPITDTLDLHSVLPCDVREVVEAWLVEVKTRGFRVLRIIHGRGIGAQREVVRSILKRDPDVLRFGDAPQEAGGWGATVVTLKGARASAPPLPSDSP